MLGAQIFLKSGSTRAIHRLEAILVTPVQIIAWPLVIVRTLPGHPVLLCSLRFVAVSQFGGNDEMS